MPRPRDYSPDDDDDRPRRRETTHRARGSFGTAFGLSSGCLLGVLTVLVAVPMLVCGGCLMLGFWASKKTLQDDASGAATESRAVKIGEEFRIGDLGITIASAKIAGFNSVSAAGREMMHEPKLVVQFTIKNYNANRVVDAGSQVGVCKLTDDVGNTYRELRATNEIGLTNTIREQIPEGKVLRVRSDSDGSDLLVFDKPVPGASRLELVLDARRYGGKGTIKATIPKSAWSP